ncbi:hypothetical protein LEP1GSC087_3180 [Leptospira interrogans serovar Bataviae str. L1111]|nr:hypothetical protein LEP1GSC087_3180 [Leptospira interrogans serovar Bataviae str. L1111]
MRAYLFLDEVTTIYFFSLILFFTVNSVNRYMEFKIHSF